MDAAVQLERLWNEVAETCTMDILCGYMLSCFLREQESRVYQGIYA